MCIRDSRRPEEHRVRGDHPGPVSYTHLDVYKRQALAVDEVARVDGIPVDLDDRAQVPLDDEATFAMIRTTRTLSLIHI